MCSGSHTHRWSIILINRLEFFLSYISHRTWSIIFRTDQRTYKRKLCMIFRCQSFFPEITFCTTNSLKIQYIRKSTIYSGRNRTTMKQCHHLVICQALCKIPSPTHSNLIITFEKVNLCPRHTIIFHLLNPVFRIFSNTTRPCPNDNFHILLFSIKTQSTYVALGPTRIKCHIFNSMLRCPINIILI